MKTISDDPVCDCGSSDLSLADHGSDSSGRPWNEYECQHCGSMFFDPPIEYSE